MHYLKPDGDYSDAKEIIAATNAGVEIQKDIKESFEAGRADDPLMPNIWYPDGVLPGFQDACLDFFSVSTSNLNQIWILTYRSLSKKACYDIEKQILKALALGFNLSEDYFLSFHTNPDNQLRLLHYPR